MDKFVVDAGPFIHLDQIHQLTLLRKLPILFVPTSVVSEIQYETMNPSLKTMKRWSNVKIISVRKKSIVLLNSIIEESGLQQGEIDCLYLADRLQPCVFLTDDLAARQTAERLQFEVHGSVGLIAYGVKKHWIPVKKAIEALDMLYEQSSLFITYAIIESAMRSLKNFENA